MSFFPIPPIPYWLWQRYLLLLDESEEVGLINGMNYRGAGVVAQILGGSTYGRVEVTEFNDCPPPDYPDGVWFTLSGDISRDDYPGATYADRIYISDATATNLVFSTNHPEWYQWDSGNGRIYNYASGSCQGAGLYYFMETTSSFDDVELCDGNNQEKKYGMVTHIERWTGTPPAPSYSTYTSVPYDATFAGCSEHTDGGSTAATSKFYNDNTQMFTIFPPVYPWYLRLYLLGGYPNVSTELGVSSTTHFLLKYSNVPYFHIPPEYQ